MKKPQALSTDADLSLLKSVSSVLNILAAVSLQFPIQYLVNTNSWDQRWVTSASKIQATEIHLN